MPTHIIILRHGKAERDSPSRGDDDRALQPRGRYQAEYIAHALNYFLQFPAIIVSSPILRARTTAEIVAQSFGVSLLVDDRLSTRHDEGDHLECLREHARDLPATNACIMLVGHNPTLSTLAAQLLVRDGGWSGELRTGEALVLRGDPPFAPNTATLLHILRRDPDE